MPPRQPKGEGQRRGRLFVYDRHDQARASLHAFFEDQGFEVVGTAADPDEAMDRILALRPDVCVLDVGIRDASGVAICKRVNSQAVPIPCIMLAPWDAPELAQASAAAGAKAFVLKNVFTGELLAAVAEALGAPEAIIDGCPHTPR